MNIEHGFPFTDIPQTANDVIGRISRLVLAVFIALVALASLSNKLSAVSRQAQIGHDTVLTIPGNDSQRTLSAKASSTSTVKCQYPGLSITKHITPLNPHTGGIVTITFIITGLRPNPADVVLIQDVSGSMLRTDTNDGRTRLAVAQEAAITFVNALSSADQVAVVAYSETAELDPNLTVNTATVIAAINALTITNEDWCTNIAIGISSGLEALDESGRYAKAMILLSDGEANRPLDNPAGKALTQAETAGDSCILIHTIGFGDGVSETLMQNIAAASGGEYYFSPDGENLATIYQEIALGLRNLVITDVLPPDVIVDIASLPDQWTVITGSGYTTIVIPINNSELSYPSYTLASFAVTVNLDPSTTTQKVNAESSSICYDGPGGPICPYFENPPTPVGGRKITGIVFEDLNHNGIKDKDENALPGVVVTSSNGLTCTTDVSGVCVLRTTDEPPLTVTLMVPPNFITTTSEITNIPASSGIYTEYFGLYSGLVGEKHSRDINGPPLFVQDELAYTITVRNISTTLYPGVTINDVIPEFTSFVPGSARILPTGTVTVINRSITGDVNSMVSQGIVSITFRVTVDKDAEGQTITNTANMTSPALRYRPRLPDEEGPHDVRILPVPVLNDPEISVEVVRPDTKVIYSYTVSNTSDFATLTNVVVTVSHQGPKLLPDPILPGNQSAPLTVTYTLTKNQQYTATVASGVEGYSGRVTGDPITAPEVHVIDGVALTPVRTVPDIVYHGDVATLYYSVVNLDQDDRVVSGTVYLVDSLGINSDEMSYSDLGPGITSTELSSPITIPQTIIITLTAIAKDDIEQTLSVSAWYTRELCPTDVYEPDNIKADARLITPGETQTRDFSGNADWVKLVLQQGDQALYTFIARPLISSQASISLTLYQENDFLTAADNSRKPQSAAQIARVLSCASAECEYFLQAQSPGANGCWTDYKLQVEQTPVSISLELAARPQVVRPATKVTFVYTVSNISDTFTLTDVEVTDSHLGTIIPLPQPIPPHASASRTVPDDNALTENQTNTATVTSGLVGYDGQVRGGPVTTTVHVIAGIALTPVHTVPATKYHGTEATLYYTVTNKDIDDGVVNGTVYLVDSLGINSDVISYSNLGPGASAELSSPINIPQTIKIILTAKAKDDILQTLSVSDFYTLTLCREDVYERNNDNDQGFLNPPIYLNMPQLHNFSGDEDWVVFRLHKGDVSTYTFSARPLPPNIVTSTLTLYAGSTITSADNLEDPRLPVQINMPLSCTGDLCQYYLQVQSPLTDGCWSDYELSVVEYVPPERHIYLPIVLKNF